MDVMTVKQIEAAIIAGEEIPVWSWNGYNEQFVVHGTRAEIEARSNEYLEANPDAEASRYGHGPDGLTVVTTVARQFHGWRESVIIWTTENVKVDDLDDPAEYYPEIEKAAARGANLAGVSLPYADLRKKVLRLANLAGADLHGASLNDADLERANLSNADLGRANLTGAHLTGAHLIGANLAGADLHGASLNDASLRNTDLRRANLRNTNLTGAYLTGADMRGADITNARGIVSVPNVGQRAFPFTAYARWGGNGIVYEIGYLKGDEAKVRAAIDAGLGEPPNRKLYNDADLEENSNRKSYHEAIDELKLAFEEFMRQYGVGRYAK